MKYYSEKTKRIYESVEELKEAEKKFDELKVEEQKKKEDKAKRLQEIESAYKSVESATEKYNALVADFVKDYGYYHNSIVRVNRPKSLVDLLINSWPW